MFNQLADFYKAYSDWVDYGEQKVSHLVVASGFAVLYVYTLQTKAADSRKGIWRCS